MDALPPNWIHTGLAVAISGALLSALLHWFAGSLDHGRHEWSRALRRRLGVLPHMRVAEVRWANRAVQLTLWLVAGYVLLRLWDLDELGQDLVDKLLGAGIPIGGTTIVPGKLILGLLAFLLLGTFTRWFKRKLERDWLPLTGMEPSVRMSVATLYGYAAFVVATLIGLSAAGLDLSRIALVAGALSLGIGFGLQNVVNNFVSGLILLFERPVRVGDYIKVGGTEGYVREIRIRSTELENGDRVSVMVPNSSLLNVQVENWNYRGNMGNVKVLLPVPRNTDPDRIRGLLLEVAADHPQVIKAGEMSNAVGPCVALQDITDTLLRFELSVNVRNVNAKGDVASELRFEILRRMAQAAAAAEERPTAP